MYGVYAVIGLFNLNRPRKSNQKIFNCARCRTVSELDPRTIQAWNNGFLKLYCASCHRQWLDNNPRQEKSQVRSNGRCLGVMAAMIIIPSIGGVGLYQWLM